MAASVVKALEELNELFDTKDKWCQGVYAIDAEGNEVSPTGRKATSWCLVGGIYQVCKRRKRLRDAVRLVIEYAVDLSTVSIYNDAPNRKFSQIKATIRKAIKLAKQAEVKA